MSDFEADEEEMENGGIPPVAHANASDQGQGNGEEHASALAAVQEEVVVEMIPTGAEQVPAWISIPLQTSGQQPLQAGV